ncbi:MAG: hypothetical protein JRF64_02935 [Deltaproteobacteria bacterium]|nr:hypothetical protein [Deltaproteobacteria bacterium]
MKRLGCDCPDTRKVSQGMIDMLISWYTFEDSLGPKMLNVAGTRLSASDD